MHTPREVKEVKDAIRHKNYEAIVDSESKDASLFAGKAPCADKYKGMSLSFDSEEA